MKGLYKAIAINAIIIITVILVDFFTTSSSADNFFGRFAVAGIVILFLGILNLGIAGGKLANKDSDGKYYLLCAGIILLIGFSVCTLPLS